jgi:hypothetical protein
MKGAIPVTMLFLDAGSYFLSLYSHPHVRQGHGRVGDSKYSSRGLQLYVCEISLVRIVE